MVVDVDNMCIAMNREENPDTKKPYSCLLKVKTSLKLTMSTKFAHVLSTALKAMYFNT